MRLVQVQFEGTTEASFMVESRVGRIYQVSGKLTMTFRPDQSETQKFNQRAGSKKFMTHPQLPGFECHMLDDGNLEVMVSPPQALRWVKSLMADTVVSFIDDTVINLLR